MTNGIINVYKEAGYTSFDVVACLRKIFNQKKIGHTGTLDPDAVGVLPVCLGNATGVVELLTDRSKEYVAKFVLGISTDTQDMTGSALKTDFEGADELTSENIKSVIMSFEGKIEQIPPMYSALKVNGQKLVDLARKGIEVERKARKVTIEEIEILAEETVPSEERFDKLKSSISPAPNSLREFTIRVVCSKGTYIRTLIDDIGNKLGCGAAMSSLIRTRVGEFKIEDAITLNQIRNIQSDPALAEKHIIMVDIMFRKLPSFQVNEKGIKALLNGNQLFTYMIEPIKNKDGINDKPGSIRVYDENGIFKAIYGYDTGRKIYSPIKMFI